MSSNMVLSGRVSYNQPLLAHQCSYKLTITYDNVSLVVEYPLTCHFNIVRNTFAQSNTATFKIINLNPSTRSLIFQDRFATDKIKLIKFEAGYNGKLALIFKGYIQEAYSQRVGTETETNIQAWDIGTADSYVSTTFEAETTFKDAYKNIVSSNKDLTLGAIGNFNGSFKTPTTLMGSPLIVLNQITGQHTYVDNGVVNSLNNNEALDYGVQVIQAESGLLGTPQRRGGEVIIESIFNPDLVVGQLVEIKSETASEFSSTYKICGINHQGVISGAVGGVRKTTLNLFIGAFLPNSNYNLTGQTTKQSFVKVKQEKIIPVVLRAGSSVQEVYNYIKTHDGDVPNKKITQNISWKELLLPSGTGNTKQQLKTQITEEILYNCETIALKLQSFLNAYYPNKTINITSGWRSKENNASLNNASKESTHLRGLAIDFNIKGVSSQVAFNNVFKPYWNKFTYLFRVSGASGYNIHVQSTLGKGGAKRA